MNGDQLAALCCLAHSIRSGLEDLIFDGYRVRPFSARWSALLDAVIVLQEGLEALHGRRAA